MVVKSFVQKIVDKKVDDLVHKRFTRFSVGEYPREAVLIKKTSKGVQMQAGFEWTTDLYYLVAELLAGSGVTLKGDGAMVTANKSAHKEIQNAGFAVKSSRGKKYTITFELSPEDLKKGLDALKDYIVLIKFKVDGLELKGKLSPPKPGSITEKFVTLKVSKDYADALLSFALFDVDASLVKKSAEVQSTFLIDDVVIPKEYENDFAAARLHAKKKGKIVRKISIDKEEVKSYEIKFEA